MTLARSAAFLYAILTLFVVLFQLALAAGAPWGAYAMGGAFPGQFPPAMRVGAVVQATLLALLAVIVLARAGIVLPTWLAASRWLIWLVVGIMVLALVLNLITPSGGERLLWAPVVFLMLASSGIVALMKTGP